MCTCMVCACNMYVCNISMPRFPSPQFFCRVRSALRLLPVVGCPENKETVLRSRRRPTRGMVKPRVDGGAWRSLESEAAIAVKTSTTLQVDGAGLGREVQHRVEFSVTHEPVTTIKFLLKDRSWAEQCKDMNHGSNGEQLLRNQRGDTKHVSGWRKV